MFDLRQTLPKYLRTFLHENAVLMIGPTDQSDYNICHLLVRFFIHTVYIYSATQVNSVFLYNFWNIHSDELRILEHDQLDGFY